MIRYLTLGEVVELHRAILDRTGGTDGIRDLGLLESALAQPKASFGGVDLHATIVDKAAALCFSAVRNHPFVDGNKRVGHAAMETFLLLSGWGGSVPDRRTGARDVGRGSRPVEPRPTGRVAPPSDQTSCLILPPSKGLRFSRTRRVKDDSVLEET